ncbi:hypothetical protein AEA09_01265 [Lysinibacillus contaminans]|uniref:Uncharacterized protein n=1 Tax=Lysinibacillus contaminans TaxID=1293441 RepID=A0ABR5K5Y6_9BACI|nr:hypothetical protein [Lysinibacillus contaminans]KOS71648.1 hypothetical protein AEA09_01265 [Lysinibacillus contaminans]
MTTLMIVLPLLFIVLFMLVVLKILKVLKNRMKIHWTPKHIFAVVTGYIAFGLLAFLYLSFFSETTLTTLSSEEIQKLQQVTEDIHRYDEENDSSFLTETYKKKSWQFEFEGDVIPVAVNEGSNWLNSDIRLRYNDDIEHGSIVLSYYQFPVIIEGLDLADEVPPPNVYMSEQQLIIESTSEHSISYNRVNASIAILDFNRIDHTETEKMESVNYQYPSVLLIEVARSTDLEDLQGRINIIN